MLWTPFSKKICYLHCDLVFNLDKVFFSIELIVVDVVKMLRDARRSIHICR